MKQELNPFVKFNDDWALVTSGSIDHFNSMTISWGEMGILWNKKVITIFIKESRYTLKFLKENDYFTVSFYEEKYRDALTKMGRLSGRDVKKDEEVGFHPITFKQGITYEEAKETYLCHKIYCKKMEYDDVTHYIIIGEIVE